jgi:SAM-dependent methyltransferase
VSAVQELLRTLDRPDVVDLGCGDFHVGRQLRPFAARYVAVDVVPELIERNRRLPDATDVEFRCLDIVSDPLPDGDVAIVRQVLQHLSNADIAEVVPKLRQYRHLVVTDHQPEGTFTPNLDMPTGPHIRVGLGSAVDLAAAPFHLPHVSTRELCVVPGDNGGVIRTTVYELAA